MKFVEFSIKNALFVNLITFFVVLSGLFALTNLQRDAFPNVSFDQVTVTTSYSGATAEDIEKLITIPLEEELKSVSGIDEISSVSEEGLSLIGLKLDPENKDKRKVVDDIRRAVDQVQDLPAEAEDPLVVELETKDMPILEISLSGSLPVKDMRNYAEEIEDILKEIDGVAGIRRFGWLNREFWVELDPDKLVEYHVSPQEVMGALRTRNITIPGGQIKTDRSEYTIRTTAEFKTPDEIMEVVVRSNDAGNALRVKDVARVLDTFEEPTRIAKVDGKESVAMVVVKRESADAITVTDKVKKIVEDFKKKLPPEITIKTANDFSYYIKRRLNVLISNGIQGFFLVVIVLFIFMEPVPAIATALGIPFSLLVTFAFMVMTGMSMNLITMLGFIIVLGMLVDDGIVVSENTYRYIEAGMSPKEAAVRGTSEVFSPILGSVTTTWAAFLPLMFMNDIIGKFISAIPVVIIVALAASLFECFLVLPSHLADWVKPSRKDSNGNVLPRHEKKWLKDLTNNYGRMMDVFIRRRYLVTFVTFLIFVGAVLLIQFKFVKLELFTGEGIEEFYIRAEAPKGTPLKKMNELIVPVEQLIATLPPGLVESTRTYLGSIEEEGGFDPNARRGSHLGQITVFLTPVQQRKLKPEGIIEMIRPKLEGIQGFEKIYFYKPKEGPPVGRAIAVAVRGYDYQVLQKIAGEFTEELNKTPGVKDVNISYLFGKKQFKINVDEAKARKYFLTVNDIAQSVKNAVRGGLATTIKPEKADREIDVLVRFPQSVRNDSDIFDKIYIPNQAGNLVPLRAVAKVEEVEGVYQISHLDGKRVIVVNGDVDGKKATSLEINQMLQKKFAGIPKKYPGNSVRFTGEFEEQQKTMKGLVISFVLVLCFIMIILAREFQSLMQPLLIMLTIPFGFIGVVYTFWLHGLPLSFFAFLGIVGLAGVVVNNSIVLIDFVNKLRRDGMELKVSLIEAGKVRLRPILMTSLTTIAGLISVAYGIGGGDPFLKPMALSIMWGLFISTAMALTIMPCVYAIIDDVSKKMKRNVQGVSN